MDVAGVSRGRRVGVAWADHLYGMDDSWRERSKYPRLRGASKLGEQYDSFYIDLLGVRRVWGCSLSVGGTDLGPSN